MSKLQKSLLFGAVFGAVIFGLAMLTATQLFSSISYAVVLGGLFGIATYLHYLNKERRRPMK